MKRRTISLVLLIALLLATAIVPVGASAATKVKILKVTVDGARVRQGPSSAYAVKTSVKKGGKVFYLGKMKNSFAYIRTSGGTQGYMYKGFLKSYGTCYKSQVYYSKKSGLKVYKKPSTHSSKVTKLSKHQHVIVYQVKGKWAYIKTVSGKGGYCQASALGKAF
ncbi:MAG: SH3 domain-containing protein [Clostridia bacterium]|nr:SH3 domain-containing protein [Clostridia bacterium]MBQ6324990.1 SH3 domain-containing protein [Clostridia bacterium]MBQ8963743.1 SH3 domain-containing protein [Clostridia bacterium]MBQ9040703.1 SH3 domain-containing protein [Clostridia bacterium]